MTAGFDIFCVRTGRATVLIGPPAALGEARGELLLGRERESAQHIELALEACRGSDAIRQHCARWGLDTRNLFYLDDLTLRAWMVAAVRHGHLGVALLPDVLFTAGAVQARVTETRARISARIDVLMRSPAGAQLARQPDKLIEALQAAARGEDPLATSGQAAPERHELTPSEVQAMALEDRMLELLRRALTSPELGATAKQDTKILLDTQTLATAIAVLTAWAATDAGKPAPLVDLALLAFGQEGLDATLIEGLKNLAEALERTRQARHAADLAWATKRLVVAIALLRPRELIRLIARGASNPYGVPLKTGGMKTRNKGISRTPQPERQLRPTPVQDDAAPRPKNDAKADQKKAENNAPEPAPPPRISYDHAPTVDEIIRDPHVDSELKKAWKESNPDAPAVPHGQPGSQKKEQGGWIVWNKKTGHLSVIRVPPGTRDGLGTIVGTRPPDNDDQQVVGWFHTHPNTAAEGYGSDPSPGDLGWQKAEAKVPGVIETHDGRKTIPHP